MEVLAAIRIGGCHRQPQCLADEASDEHRLGARGAAIEDAKLRFSGEAFFNEVDKLNGFGPLPAYCRRGRIRIIRDALAAVPDGWVDVVAFHMLSDQLEDESYHAGRWLIEEELPHLFRKLGAWSAQNGGFLGIEVIEEGAPRNTGYFADPLNGDCGKGLFIHQLCGGILYAQARLEAFLLA